jgi:hypothetical protein
MKKHYTFFWLDDNKSKVDDMRSVLETGVSDTSLTSTVHFAEMTSEVFKNLEDVGNQIKSQSTDMILVDHVINEMSPLSTKGSSVAHLLRSMFPHLPIVCVSAAWGPGKTEAAFDQEDLSEYTRIFPYGALAQDAELELLFAIARDFSRCVAAVNGGQVSATIGELFGAWTSEIPTLERILPSEFRAIGLKTTPHRLARWILSMFVARPGYLYNEIRAATLMGLSLDGFAKVRDKFVDSLYSGVFATDTSPRWWVARLHEQLASLVSDDSPSNTQLAGRRLENITEQDFSKCHYDETASPPPDSVAYLDDASKEEVAVQGAHTKVYPADVGGLPGFEPRLVLIKR